MRSISNLVLACLVPFLLIGCAQSNETAPRATKSPPATMAAEASPPTTRPTPPPAPATPVVDSFVRTAYDTQCLPCHGATGAGDGKMVAMLSVKPRSFAEPTWRYVDLSADEDTVLADIERVLREGIPDAMMPAYAGTYSPEQIRGLAEYVLILRRQSTGS